MDNIKNEEQKYDKNKKLMFDHYKKCLGRNCAGINNFKFMCNYCMVEKRVMCMKCNKLMKKCEHGMLFCMCIDYC